MTQSDDELLNYEEDQAALAKKGLAAEAVTDATAQLADVTLKTKPATKEVTMTDATLPGEANANLIKMLADAIGGNRIGNSLHNIKYLNGDEGPEQVRRWFSEFELITRGWSDEEKRQALQVRVQGRAATAVQLMPRDLLDDYSKIKCELLLRLADDEPRRSANLTSLLSGCTRLPNETVEQFGARVQMLARDALEPNCPLSQVDAIAKQCFINGLDDEQLLPALISQRDHTEFRYLIDNAANLRRNFDLHAAKRSATVHRSAPTTNKGNRQQNGPYHNATWEPPQAWQGYAQDQDTAPTTFQPRNPAPSGPGPKTGNYKNSATSPGNITNAQNSWMKPAQGQIRTAPAAKSNNVGTGTGPNNANALQTAEVPSHIGLLARHKNTYDLAAPFAGQTHNTFSAVLPVSTLDNPKAGPCAIGPVPKRDILVENMPAVSLLDSGAPVSIAAAGYVKGLLEAKGVDPDIWPIDPPSTEISVANGDPLNCVGSTILHVSIGDEAKPVRVQLTSDTLSYPVIIGTNAFTDLEIGLVSTKSGVSVLEHNLRPVNQLPANFPKPPDKVCVCESSAARDKPCTEPPDRMRVPNKSAKRQAKRERHVTFAEPEVHLSVQSREGSDCAQRKNKMRKARENDGKHGQPDKKLQGKPPPSSLSDHTSLGVSKRPYAPRINTAFGQHWLRNVPRAHATFPPRRLDMLHFGSAGDAPDSQPSTSGRSNDATLNSVRSCRTNRYDAPSSSRSRSSHDASYRSSSRSRYDIDSHLPNDPFSVLQLSGPSSSPFDHHDQKRQ